MTIESIGKLLLLTGALALLLRHRALWSRDRDTVVLAQALGAVLATGAALLWWGGVAVTVSLPWWAGFVVLTIGGQRVKHFQPPPEPRVSRELTIGASGLTAMAPAALLFPEVGYPIYGLTLLAVTGWLLHHDPARHIIRSRQGSRLAAAAVLAGYGWLLVAGAIWLLGGAVVTGPGYYLLITALLLFALATGLPSLSARPEQAVR